MVDKEVARALLERQDINDLHLLLNRALAFQQNQPEGLTSTDHEWALHWQKLVDMVPMNALHALVLRCCFHCDHPMHGVGGHGCKHDPSDQEQAGLDRSSWDTRWGGAGPSGKDGAGPFLDKLAAHQQGTAPGATYVTAASSQPYTRPGVPRPVHVLTSFGPSCTPFQCQTRRGSR